MKTIGIIGGMGPLATADLYKKITLSTQASCDQEQIPIIIDSNTAIPDRTACIINGGASPLPQMEKSIRRLEAGGADFLIMPCNTAHYFYEALTKLTSLPILNMLALTVAHCQAQYGSYATIGLLATDGTVRSGIYKKYFEKTSMKLLTPEKNQRAVMDFIYEGIKKNNFAIGIDGLMSAVDELRALGADACILGCTELSAATDYYPLTHGFIDPLLVLAQEAVKTAGGTAKDSKIMETKPHEM